MRNDNYNPAPERWSFTATEKDTSVPRIQPWDTLNCQNILRQLETKKNEVQWESFCKQIVTAWNEIKLNSEVRSGRKYKKGKLLMEGEAEKKGWQTETILIGASHSNRLP